jgi:predicted nucleotidyltransferase
MRNAQSFIETLERHNIHIEVAYLFGSYARGTAHRYSDIDLALVSPTFSGVRFSDTELIIQNTPSTFFLIEPHPFRPEDFTEENPFVREILHTGVRIV